MRIMHGDCLDILKTLPDNSVDAVVTDPPYGLSFMGKKWDYDVPSEEIWRECLRVLKPGGHLLSFAGTRTQHRMAVRIEDAGFEIRDMIAWIYGSGFPKSMNISKALDKELGAEREKILVPTKPGNTRKDRGNSYASEDFSGFTDISDPVTEEAVKYSGWGTALKPALEPVTVARKPLSEKTVAANVLKWGTGAINIDGGRVATSDKLGGGMVSKGRPCVSDGWDRPWMHDPAVTELKKIEAADKVEQAEKMGRFPANLIHDGSDEVLELFPESGKTGQPKRSFHVPSENTCMSGANCGHETLSNYGDSGSAARFFYCAKASKTDRGADNKHPTVKPTDLMRYLCRLVTPPRGVVLDPFMGSGSTGKAARIEGFDFIGIERESEYVEIARARIEAVTA